MNLKVKWAQDDNVLQAKIIEQNDSLRRKLIDKGEGLIIKDKNFRILSIYGPELDHNKFYICGKSRSRDKETACDFFPAKESACSAREGFQKLIDRINEMELPSFQERFQKNRKNITKMKPCVRTIKIDGEPMSLAFPYMYFLNTSNVLWSMQDMDNLNDDELENMKFFIPFLPNVFEDGDICWGSGNTPCKKDVVSAFLWVGFYTGDGGSHCHLEDTKLKDFRTWQKRTKNRSPLEVFSDVIPSKEICREMRDLL